MVTIREKAKVIIRAMKTGAGGGRASNKVVKLVRMGWDSTPGSGVTLSKKGFVDNYAGGEVTKWSEMVDIYTETAKKYPNFNEQYELSQQILKEDRKNKAKARQKK